MNPIAKPAERLPVNGNPMFPIIFEMSPEALIELPIVDKLVSDTYCSLSQSMLIMVCD